MKVIDFFECNNRNYWLEQIAKTDWRSGKYLYELLKSNSLHEKIGSFAKVLLLVDGDLLLAFCTVSEKKYDIDSQFSPWIGLFDKEVGSFRSSGESESTHEFEVV